MCLLTEDAAGEGGSCARAAAGGSARGSDGAATANPLPLAGSAAGEGSAAGSAAGKSRFLLDDDDPRSIPPANSDTGALAGTAFGAGAGGAFAICVDTIASRMQ